MIAFIPVVFAERLTVVVVMGLSGETLKEMAETHGKNRKIAMSMMASDFTVLNNPINIKITLCFSPCKFLSVCT